MSQFFFLSSVTASAATWPCPIETVFTNPSGTFTIGPFSTGGASKECHYVWNTGSASSLTLTFSTFSLGGSDCTNGNPNVKIFDGSTMLAPLLARFYCSESWSVASSNGTMLFVFYAGAVRARTQQHASPLPSGADCISHALPCCPATLLPRARERPSTPESSTRARRSSSRGMASSRNGRRATVRAATACASWACTMSTTRAAPIVPGCSRRSATRQRHRARRTRRVIASARSTATGSSAQISIG